MTTALCLAAKRGVDIKIVTPGIPDKKLVFLLTQSYYKQLVEAGIHIYEYTPGFIHAKNFLVDDKCATVGTINLDYRSLYLHFENAVFKAVRKVGINVDKEELLKALIYDRGQYDKGYEDAMNEVKHPQPLKFEDLKEGMWIYDAPYEEIVRIKEIESNEWIFLECIKSKDLSNTFFQEGRFYPIQIPNIGTE